MLFKPDVKESEKVDGESLNRRVPRKRGGMLATAIVLLILGALSYFGWVALQQKQRQAGRGGGRPDVTVPVLAAIPRVQDMPVYLEGVGAVKALNTVTVRPQVDGKLTTINFVEGQDVKKGDVLAEIDPVLYQALYDQAVAKKAQDEALLSNQRLDLVRYQQLAASNAGSKQQYDTQRATVAQQEALVKADQAAIENAQATLGYTRIIAPLTGRTGLRQVDQGNIVHAADATGVAIITQLQPIAVLFSLPQQQIARVNAAVAGGAVLAVDVFGNDGVTVADTGKLTGIDNQVDPTTGTLKFKAEFPNAKYQLWPGQFVNVRLKVETIGGALVVPTAAVQRGPVGTFSYVIGENDIVTAKPVSVTMQNENDAVIASGLSPEDRVVTTGFANLSDGAKVSVGNNDQVPTADLAPRRRGSRGPREAKDGEPKKWEGKKWDGKGGEDDAERSERRRHRREERMQRESGADAPAPSPAAKASP
jgi:membrane fusion protein, multidrug efflux system